MNKISIIDIELDKLISEVQAISKNGCNDREEIKTANFQNLQKEWTNWEWDTRKHKNLEDHGDNQRRLFGNWVVELRQKIKEKFSFFIYENSDIRFQYCYWACIMNEEIWNSEKIVWNDIKALPDDLVKHWVLHGWFYGIIYFDIDFTRYFFEINCSRVTSTRKSTLKIYRARINNI